ncbi:E3 SUMO-protein ligase ZBED1-like [Ornithodoros turicata]|uniref:E3 SUMO-protein ligase ZBED1-like n=1 Tax=Ornithodoros turicata TaxID=34597 RepID=UPI003138EA74
MIAKEYEPFSLVEGQEFKTFLAMLNPGYQLPSRKTLSTVHIPQMYNKVHEQVKNELTGISSICLTTDGWTSLSNQSYIALTANFIHTNGALRARLLDCFAWQNRHTAENIAAELRRVVVEWEIQEKVCAVVSDNAANITAAIRLLGWKHFPCFAHTLNLIVQAGVKEISEVQTKVKNIVTFLKHSAHGTAKLETIQQQMGLDPVKLKQDVVTRWHCTYDMFTRMLYVRDAVLSAIVILEADLHPLVSTEWTILEKACEILKPFKEVTEEMSSEKNVTISKVILLANGLMQHIDEVEKDDLPRQCRNMAKAMKAQVKRRFDNIEGNSMLAEATVFDPRFKQYGFSKRASYEASYRSISHHVSRVETAHCNPEEEETPRSVPAQKPRLRCGSR